MSDRRSPGGRSVVVFDLGGVLIDWNPRHLYRKLFGGDDAAMERFLVEVCSPAWNLRQDAGRSFAEGCALLCRAHPDRAVLIEAFFARWEEMLAGPIDEVVAILEALDRGGVPLYALTNWSTETFPIGRRRFPFLDRFRGIVVSGEEGVVKPDPRIYRRFAERFGIDPGAAIFIDDNAQNAAAATALGWHGIHFTDPAALRRALMALGLPIAPS